MPSKQEKSGQVETGLTEPAATPCDAVMTSSRFNDIFLILTAVNCGNLTDPANGSVAHTAGTDVGQTATYSCNTGYHLVGDSTRTCQNRGNWSGDAPTCQGKFIMSTVIIRILRMIQSNVRNSILGIYCESNCTLAGVLISLC